MSSSDEETPIPTSTSIQSVCRPRLVRDLSFIAFVFTITSVWKSHEILYEQTSFLTEGDYSVLPAAPINAKRKITIAYCISLTKCNPETANLDGAAVLKHSIQRFDAVSSKYDSKFYAFVHPNATECAGTLEKFGYDIQIRPTPINTTDIRGHLKNYVEGASCCGSAEFLKLYSYTLTQHPVVVHFDMDVAVLKPMDDLYDSIIEGPSSPARRRIPAMWIHNVSNLPKQIDAFFTRDYNMLNSAGHRKTIETSIQGGFMVVRPNMTVFQEYLDIILEGVYEPAYGWGGPKLRFGGTFGSAQIQGLVCYYYGHVHPGTAVELNRCIYNSMVDEPTDKKGVCLAPQEDGYCEDCRKTNISDVVTTHYTLCQKPWWCMDYDEPLCGQTHKQWFQARWELEMQRQEADPSYRMAAVTPQDENKDRPWVVNGNWSFCGPDGYIKMKPPPGFY